LQGGGGRELLSAVAAQPFRMMRPVGVSSRQVASPTARACFRAIGRLADAQLLVTELLSNAVRHSERDHVWMAASVTESTLRVEVSNAGPAFDERARRDPSYEAAGGWGLRIVELMAHRWGIDSRADGVHVWFEVDRPESDAALEITGEAPPPA
jgi:anti-sigma regulatory factor (Ser/Thr protein kinase)